MIINSINVTNLRAIEYAEFEFRPGMNLIVGVNGVGKTTLLDALRICLSQVLADITVSRSRLQFNNYDIRLQAEFLDVTCKFNLNKEEFSYIMHRNRDNIIWLESDSVREQTKENPNKKEYYPPLTVAAKKIKQSQCQPVGVFFGTRRSLISDVAPAKSSIAGGQVAAFANALLDREIRQQEIAAWILAQKELGREQPLALKHLRVMQQACNLFMPGYTNLRVATSPERCLVVDKSGETLEFRQLSDGERSMFVIALEIAKRLSQANPFLEDPVKDGSAIVLIDEIDLHLHPKWQRTIVNQLTKTFPSCQFIATSHSPQIIGEVENDRIQIIADGQVYSPTYSFGVDSSRVLEEIMASEPRTTAVKALLAEISRKIGEQQFESARELLEKLSKLLGDGDPEVTRLRILLDFVEGKE